MEQGKQDKHDEGQKASRKKTVEEKKEHSSKSSSIFRKIPLKAKMAILAAMAAAAVGFFGFALPWVIDDHETQYLATSDLISAVDIESLSTIDYTYHGVAAKHSKLLWQDHVDYRVKYTAHIRASYALSDIQFDIDENNKSVTAYLPDAQIGNPQLDSSKFDYLPEDATADIKDVIALCRKDAANDVDKKEIEEQANANLQETVKALILPLLGDKYELKFKPISEYDGGNDSNV